MIYADIYNNVGTKESSNELINWDLTQNMGGSSGGTVQIDKSVTNARYIMITGLPNSNRPVAFVINNIIKEQDGLYTYELGDFLYNVNRKIFLKYSMGYTVGNLAQFINSIFVAWFPDDITESYVFYGTLGAIPSITGIPKYSGDSFTQPVIFTNPSSEVYWAADMIDIFTKINNGATCTLQGTEVNGNQLKLECHGELLTNPKQTIMLNNDNISFTKNQENVKSVCGTVFDYTAPNSLYILTRYFDTKTATYKPPSTQTAGTPIFTNTGELTINSYSTAEDYLKSIMDVQEVYIEYDITVPEDYKQFEIGQVVTIIDENGNSSLNFISQIQWVSNALTVIKAGNNKSIS